jgi:drug/metabolite transporter (DMT)-like permease
LNRLLGYLLLLTGMSLVGTYVALSRPLTEAMPVALLAWLRFGIAAVAMLPWTVAPIREGALDRAQWARLFWMAFFGNFLFSAFMLNGVAMTSAATAGVVLSTLPAVVALVCWFALGERLDGLGWSAVVLAVAGVAILALARGDGAATGDQPALGALLLLGCAVCEAVYVVHGKRLTGALSPMRISALINLFGLALVTPFGLHAATGFDFAGVGGGTWALLVFYAISASIVSTWLWLSGLKRVPANHSGVFTVALPVASSLVGVVWLGERFTGAHAVAFGLAALGIVLAAWPRSLGRARDEGDQGSLADFIRDAPLAELDDIDTERDRSLPRQVDIETDERTKPQVTPSG